MAVTARDLTIFKLLDGYRYLRSNFIHAFVGGRSAKRFKERLGDLFHEGYLDRPEQQWRLADGRCMPAVHEIGRGARRVLAGFAQKNPVERTYLGQRAHRQYLHSLLICEVLASIELAVATTPGVRFIPWAEILARAPEATRTSARPFALPVPGTESRLVPDAIFGLQYRDAARTSYRFFALEIDRATMPVARTMNNDLTSFAAKLEAYKRIIASRSHKAHLGVSTLCVLTVTPGEAHLRTMMCGLGGDDAGAFLFKALPEDARYRGLTRPVPELFAEPWQRARLEPLRIQTA